MDTKQIEEIRKRLDAPTSMGFSCTHYKQDVLSVIEMLERTKLQVSQLQAQVDYERERNNNNVALADDQTRSLNRLISELRAENETLKAKKCVHDLALEWSGTCKAHHITDCATCGTGVAGF